MTYIRQRKKARTWIANRYETQLYRALSFLAILIMTVAAYMTYGYQKREIFITSEPTEKNDIKKSQHLEVTGDLSLIPSDTELRKILNKQLPHVCDDCDGKPLSCLDEYTMNKILMTGEQGESILSAEIMTGKLPKKYFVLIDLSHNNTVIKKGGEIDTRECVDAEQEESVDQEAIYLDKGHDANETVYLEIN